MLDLASVLDGIRPDSPKHLELGCGESKRNPAAIGVDAIPYPGVDLVGDAVEVLKALPAFSLSSVASEHFIEHIDDLEGLMNEVSRTLVPGGTFTASVPHFSSPYYYSDPTHRRSFGLYTFCYLIENSPFRRQVPNYGSPLPFRIEKVILGFKSSPPFYGRHAVKRILGTMIAGTRWGAEFYEENLCWIFPCYEITYILRRTPGALPARKPPGRDADRFGAVIGPDGPTSSAR